MSERDKAQALMVDYGKHVGKMDAAHRSFDENNDRSFGDFGFHYFPDRGVLQARVYVSRTINLTDYPEQVPAVRKSAVGLNDPEIGGMFDRAGGYFVLDEQKQMFFLCGISSSSSLMGPRLPNKSMRCTILQVSG